MFAVAGATSAFVPDRTRVETLVPGALHGDIEITSFGVATVSADAGPPIQVLHVRERFANRDDRLPWVVDASAASAWTREGTPELQPIFVNGDAPTLPLLVIARGEQRTADVYFPLPAGVTEDSLTLFNLTVRIGTADHRYADHVTLARSNRWPSREERGLEPGWGPRWWSDPSYPWASYRHQPGYVVPKPPTRVEILHVPRALYEVLPAFADDVADFEQWPRTDECDEW